MAKNERTDTDGRGTNSRGSDRRSVGARNDGDASLSELHTRPNSYANELSSLCGAESPAGAFLRAGGSAKASARKRVRDEAIEASKLIGEYADPNDLNAGTTTLRLSD